MFKHILMPLDGSRLAEMSLPAAVALSKILGASVTLVHVIERNAPREIHGERHLSTEDEALKYLDEMGRRAFLEGVKVECHVHTEEVDNVARSIAAHVGELGSDLIILCSHGAGGLRDLMTGSIAQQVIGMGKTPVYLIRPGVGKSLGEPVFNSFLVALDGSEEHEQGLSVAGGLARQTGATLRLVSVVKTPGTLSGGQAQAGRLLPITAAAMLDMNEDCFRQYLEERAEELRQQGISVSCEVRRGEPPQQLKKSAEAAADDLIILGTHGKAGMGAFWRNSVGAKLTSLTHIPLLLVPLDKSVND